MVDFGLCVLGCLEEEIVPSDQPLPAPAPEPEPVGEDGVR